MAFDLMIWQEKMRARLPGWKARLARAGVTSAYAGVSALALWPVVEAARQGEWAALAALGGVLAGLGSNLLANQLQGWKDEADAAKQLAAALPANPALRAEMDEVLEKLDALGEAGRALGEADQAWFVETLRAEIPKLGSRITHINMTNVQDGSAVALGDGAVAVGRDGVYIGGPVYGSVTIHKAADPRRLEAENTDAARQQYLKNLARDLQFLPLVALGSDPESDRDITLEEVYITLNTTESLKTPEAKEHIKQARVEGLVRSEDDEPYPALSAAAEHNRLVLLGDPGSGKSTFARHLLAWQAGGELGGPPPTGIPRGLLPVFVVLRDLLPRLDPDALENLTPEKRDAALVEALRAQILDDLKRLDASGFQQGMLDALRAGKILLALDGLDEAPQAWLSLIRGAVRAFTRLYPLKRIVITCRVRSYAGDAEQPGFQPFTLAPFTPEQIRAFIGNWYDVQQRMGRENEADANRKREDLRAAALNKDLSELSQNPMMLTSMAIVHQKNHALPSERVRLYNLVVDVLLKRWQRRKAGGDLSPHAALNALLKDDLRLRQIMERLAYEAHQIGRNEAMMADLPRMKAVEILERREYAGELNLAQAFLDYVDVRAGLLVGRGGQPGHPASYSFPHRTFQEYLAGCYVTSHPLAAQLLLELAGEPEYWTVAVELGAEEIYHNTGSGGPNTLRRLYKELFPAAGFAHPADQRRALWAAKMAALLGEAGVANDPLQPGTLLLGQYRETLVGLLGSELTPVERADAGRALAKLGDPRPEVMAVDAMPFCFIPAGPFRLGSDRKKDGLAGSGEATEHKITLPACWIGQYPVTNAQYAAFVEAGGYADESLWGEAKKENIWKHGAVKGLWDNAARVSPESFGLPFALPNHPVVGVTWYECLAFTRWLTRHGRERGWLRPGWTVDLPSEAEWEKAARGGLEIPVPVAVPLPLSRLQEAAPVLAGGAAPNPFPARVFPYPGDFDAECGNTSASRIGATSALGCFPRGASPYGVLDLSGNVWEWTRTLWGKDWDKPEFKYPYSPGDGRENLEAGDDIPRVLRGGSFDYDEYDARCAFRNWLNPPDWNFNLGFRVVVSPSS